MGDETLRRVQVLEGKRLVCDLICGPPSWWASSCPDWDSEMNASLLQSAKQVGAEIGAGGFLRLVFGSKDTGQELEARVVAEKAVLTLVAVLSRATDGRPGLSAGLLKALTETFVRCAAVVSPTELKRELQSSLSGPA